jgi:hypothetical protein
MMDAIVGEEGWGPGGGGGSFCSLYIYIYTEFVKSNWHTSNHPSASLQKRRMGGKIFQVMNEWNIYCSLSIIQMHVCMQRRRMGEGFSTNE